MAPTRSLSFSAAQQHTGLCLHRNARLRYGPSCDLGVLLKNLEHKLID